MTVPADGIVLVDKPTGVTSHTVVSAVRRLVGTRRVGHAGTLDPMATGVLVVGVGRATRLLGYLTASDKSYRATIRLGETTVSDDADGELVASVGAADLDVEAIRSAARGFTGAIEQVPSAVSAVKVDGRRAYQRVRDGETVTLAPRAVVVSRLDVGTLSASVGRSGIEVRDVTVEVHCSAGTYVRALARDIGAVLGVGGHLVELRRTASGVFTECEATSLAELPSPPPTLGLEVVARRCFPTRSVDEAEAAGIVHGRPLSPTGRADEVVAVLGPGGQFLALVRDRPGRRDPDVVLARPEAVFVDAVPDAPSPTSLPTLEPSPRAPYPSQPGQ